MMQYARQRTAFFPTLCIREERELPLGNYGCEMLKNMQKNYPQRYWQLSFDGKLMQTLQKRERELLDLKYDLIEEIEKKFPRPITQDLYVTMSHMDLIDEQAEMFVQRELVKPI